MKDPRRDARGEVRPSVAGSAGEALAEERVRSGAEASIAAYPTDLEHPATLTDGRVVFVRPIRPTDADELRRAIAAADPETLHARFLGSPPHNARSIHHLVEVDYLHRLALVACDTAEVGVGVARYEGGSEGDTAEAAVVVDPGWRRVGLGSLLLRDLSQAALQRGFTQFTALILAENRPVLALLRASGLSYSAKTEGGTSRLAIQLDQPPDRHPPEEAGLPRANHRR